MVVEKRVSRMVKPKRFFRVAMEQRGEVEVYIRFEIRRKGNRCARLLINGSLVFGTVRYLVMPSLGC